MLALAAELDGHPDNVAAALAGGMVVVVPVQGGGYTWTRLTPPVPPRVAVALPNLALPTKQARGVLPSSVAFADAAFNVGRAALLVAALGQGRFDLLSTAMQDRLHQDYRIPLVPGGPALLKELMREGWGICLSGSGPSVIALGTGDGPGAAMAEAFRRAGVRCRILNLQMDERGACLERGGLGADAGVQGGSGRTCAGWSSAPVVVQKYGGSSVATPGLMRLVAGRVAEVRRTGARVVVVVSAMGDSTDDLLSLARAVARDPERRELDALMATGEQVSVALLAMALQDLGIDAVSMSGGRLGIATDGVFCRARVSRVNTDNIRTALAKGQVVIAAGFQGTGPDGMITTLGRGGSDATAVVLAAALEAWRCEIYTDVEGVYTADPRVVPEARLLPRLSYDEMSEMASLGAKVMQLRSVELARRHGVPLVVRRGGGDGPGTAIGEVGEVDAMDHETMDMEGAVVRAVTHSVGEAKVVLEDVPDVPGVAAKVFGALAAQNIRVDMIIQGRGRDGNNDIVFTVAEDDRETAVAACEEVAAGLGGCRVTVAEAAKVSVVGAGISQDARVAAAMFECLADLGINIEMISTSGLRISCLIRPDKVEEAVRALHARLVAPAGAVGAAAVGASLT
jgi:aspartate kinase